LGKHQSLIVPTALSLFVALGVNAVIHDHRGIFARLLTFRPLVWIGIISYSLYLWQQLFCTTRGSLPLKTPWCLLCAVVLAMGSYFLIERPSLNLRQRWFSSSATPKAVQA
ncbi:MAG: acyltransferase, partial [Phycisphaerae bacterium]|nr:acyltransferase [Phycisphaerae bacterium]